MKNFLVEEKIKSLFRWKGSGILPYYPHLNDIYISEGLKQRLEEINTYPLTTIIAPMGFGKTTAINWWAKRQVENHPNTIVLRQMIFNDSISEFWAGFCRAFKGFPELAEQIRALGYPQDANSIAILAELLLDSFASTDSPIFIIMDDLYLLKQKSLIALLLHLARSLPECFHIILLSRNQIFNGEERMRLGNSLGEITVEDLRLTPKELGLYAKQCGLKPAAKEIEALATLSEGWISMVYLNFKAYAQRGKWLSDATDIFALIEQVLLEPLPKRQRDFLILNGVVDEFTAEQAEFLWRGDDALDILNSLSQNNAFITKGDNGFYRYHHMLQQSTRYEFAEKTLDYQQKCHSRLGKWFLHKEDYVPAYLAFAKANNWEGLLKTLEIDKAKSLNTEHSQEFFRWTKECPEELWLNYPIAIVATMVKMFSFHNIPEIMRMKALLLKALEENNDLTEVERNNLLGDAEVSESFLRYNDISAMSIHHRRACSLLSRTSLSVDPKGAWTFSAPSILMMYHRTIGGADKENAEMQECMPYYYQVSDGHGNGAEYSFAADLFYERGQVADADISNQMARRAAKRKNQYSVILCCDFLAMRMAFFKGDLTALKKINQDCQEWLRHDRQYTLLNTLDMCQGFLYALSGQTKGAPEWLAKGRLQDALVLFPASPMLNTFYNQLLLAQGEWTTLLARQEECKKLYSVYNNVLCQIWLHIQMAAALEQIGKGEDALNELQTALNMAIPDDIIMPFAESEAYIMPLLLDLQSSGVYPVEIEAILVLADKFRTAKQTILNTYENKLEQYGLSEREWEIAKLAAGRKTNLEIAQELHLAEGTVRNQLSRIFDKLNITGNSKNKRLELRNYLKQ